MTDDKYNGTIRIVLDEKYDVHYSSIDNKSTIECIQKLRVLDRLSEKLPIEYNWEDYCVAIDEIVIDENTYFVIIVSGPNCVYGEKTFTDTATGLYNRNYWEQISSGEIFYPMTQNVSLVFIDVDNLKEINDNYGHLVGDKAIQIVAEGIKRSIRREDLGIRYGGDEFLILLINQNSKAVENVIERIREKIGEIAKDNGLDIKISAGIACHDCLDFEEMIKTADMDLYREKSIKKEKKLKSDNINNLRKEIETIKSELENIGLKKVKTLSKEDILVLSRKLDGLIKKYLRK